MNINNLKKEIKKYGIKKFKKILYNSNFSVLLKEEQNINYSDLNKVLNTNYGAISINTVPFTGRSPLDKYIVYDDNTKNKVWWTDNGNNKPININTWCFLKKLVINQLNNKKIFVIDFFCGTDINNRLKIRFITEIPWQAHFVKNMFIIPNKKDLEKFKPNFIILNGSRCKNIMWNKYNLNSEVFIAFNFTEKIQIIGGTLYNGEIKKGIFLIMNYFLPPRNVLPMHCAANMSKNNDVTLFFGLSGTGKTTLSNVKNYYLIGDDEHGWNENGHVFNFEGGCYAKIINLTNINNPEIFSAIKKNAILENVVVLDNGFVDFSDNKNTENTRVSFPISYIRRKNKSELFINNVKNIIFLTADYFRVLPLVSILSLEQSQYYFLSGFTTKLSNTELNIIKPIPTFSACFSEPFLPLHPIVYTKLLTNHLLKNDINVFLVNTGWDYYGNRISIKKTKIIINNILNFNINKKLINIIPIFNLSVPKFLDGLDHNLLDPRNYYINKEVWKYKAKILAKLLKNNFNRFLDTNLGKLIIKSGPEI
ncbi:MAG: phosphoenolpyruvate carboxykinase (ATP) [Candidatus Lightella neohaematopini]|nr:phosphoenolpyruvate carboxykinase (ATP) [Candidatus Lightella neohaematopini]